VTSLRQRVLDELQRRNYSPATTRGYILAIKQFADYFGKSPECLGGDEIRQFETYLLRDKMKGKHSKTLLAFLPISHGERTEWPKAKPHRSHRRPGWAADLRTRRYARSAGLELELATPRRIEPLPRGWESTQVRTAPLSTGLLAAPPPAWRLELPEQATERILVAGLFENQYY